MQDLAYCDYYCTPVKFQEPDIFVFVGEIKGLMPVFITPISCITVQIRKAWTFNVNSRLLISAHPETVFLPDLFVMLKILSSEYQLYACGKIFRRP